MSAKGVLPEFQEFLLTHKLAQEKHVLFLAVWVSKFLAFSNRKGHQDLGLTVMEFLKSLETKEDEVSRYLLFDRLSPVAHPSAAVHC